MVKIYSYKITYLLHRASFAITAFFVSSFTEVVWHALFLEDSRLPIIEINSVQKTGAQEFDALEIVPFFRFQNSI